MTLQRARNAVARLGETGAVLVPGICGVGLAAILVVIAPMTTNAGVLLAFLGGLAVGNVAWSWITSTPFSWRRPSREGSRWRAALELVVGIGLGILAVRVFEQIIEPYLPTQRVADIGPNGGVFYEDIPGDAVVWLAVLWLAILATHLLSNLAKRVFRASRSIGDRNAA